MALANAVPHDDCLPDGTAWLDLRSGSQAPARRHLQAGESIAPLLRLLGDELESTGLCSDKSTGSACAFSQALSRAMHQSLPNCDGILYASRQSSPGKAATLFERGAVTLAQTIALLDHPQAGSVLELFSVKSLPPAYPPTAKRP